MRPVPLITLGIDASGIVTGGGLVHLRELLSASRFVASRFGRIVCWTAPELAPRLPALEHVKYVQVPEIGRGILARARWQRWILPRLMAEERCEFLFVAGSTSFFPGGRFATINHNLLPFEWAELRREGLTRQSVRLVALRVLQGWTMRRCRGTIFLTPYAQEVITRVSGPLRCRTKIVPHGVNEEFRCVPREPRRLSDCSASAPFRILYVSPIAMYKHQWNVVRAFGAIRRSGIHATLDLVGARNRLAGAHLDRALAELEPAHRAEVRHRESIAHGELPELFRSSDLFVFASSCETFGITLVEAMAAGLPIACSSRGPMPSILGSKGFYFDPLSPVSIERAMRTAIDSPRMRRDAAQDAYERSLVYSWQRCARETFEFVRAVHRERPSAAVK